MKLFTIDSVYIEAFGKLKTAWNAVLLNAGQTQLNIWPFKFGYSRFCVTLFGNTFTKLRICSGESYQCMCYPLSKGGMLICFL